MMRKALIALLAVASISVASAQRTPLRLGFSFGFQANAGSPLSLPLVQPADTILTFLGSFKAPTNFAYGAWGMSVSGSTMYMGGLYYYNSGNNHVPGIGSFTIPALSGTPAYDGSNGTASTTGSVAPTLPTDVNGNPTLNCGQAVSSTFCTIDGSIVYNGKLYLTTTPYLDSAGGANGFIFDADTGLSTFGSVDNSSTSPATYTRYFAGALGIVPSIWQPYLGGPCYVVNGAGEPIDGKMPAGFLFATFDCGAYDSTGTNPVPVTQYFDYYWPSGNDLTQALEYRSFGAVPSGGSGMSLTITGGNGTGVNGLAGATAITLAAAFPGYSWTSGTGSGLTGTLGSLFYQITFSDGEIRYAHITQSGTTAVPDGANICASGCTSFPALTCSSCTTTITVKPASDNWRSEGYDGLLGYGFIVPGSRSLLIINDHSYGFDITVSHNTDNCNTSSSGSNDTPMQPDTVHYRRIQITAYDLNEVYSNIKSGKPVYQVSPYNEWDFPNWAAAANTTTGCPFLGGEPNASGQGSFFFDPATSILYGFFTNNLDASGHMVIDEWKVAGT